MGGADFLYEMIEVMMGMYVRVQDYSGIFVCVMNE